MALYLKAVVADKSKQPDLRALRAVPVQPAVAAQPRYRRNSPPGRYDSDPGFTIWETATFEPRPRSIPVGNSPCIKLKLLGPVHWELTRWDPLNCYGPIGNPQEFVRARQSSDPS
jgi:hypothetical protein